MSSENSLRFNFLAGRETVTPTMAKIGRQSEELKGKLARFGGFAATALKGAAVAAAGFGAAGLAMGVKTAAGMEQAQIGFTSLLGSGQKARSFLADLQKFAASTPFELPGLIESSRYLIGVGVDARKTMGILKSFGDAASAVGIGQEQFQRIMLATSQAISAGRFMTADLNQITANGIPIWTELSRATGKPIPKLRDLASQGKLLASDVLPLLERQMGKDYGGAMAKQSQTLNGLWSTFMDTLNLGLGSAIAPMIPALKQGLAGATRVASGALKGLPAVLDTVFGKLGDLKSLVTDKLAPALRTAFSGLGDRLPSIDLSRLGATFKAQAARWSAGIITGIRAGLDRGDWKPLGSSLGKGLGDALTHAAGLGAQLGKAVMGWIGEVDWLHAGAQAAAVAVPFAVGFINNLAGSLIKFVVQHPVDVAELALAFIPLGKFAAAFGPLRSLIEHLPLGKSLIWLFDHTAVKAFDAVTGLAKKVLGFLGSGFKEGFTSVFPDITSGLLGKLRRLGDDVGARALYFADKGRDLIRGLGTGIGKASGWAARAVVAVIKVITWPFRAPFEWLLPRGVEVVRGLAAGVQRTIGRVGDVIGRVIERVKSPFGRAAGWLRSAGGRVVGGLKDGIWGAIKGIGSWIKSNLIDPIVNAVKGFFGIKSPSRVFAAIGGHLVGGLMMGMLRAGPGKMIRTIFGSMPKALKAIVDKGILSITQLPKKALNALGPLLDPNAPTGPAFSPFNQALGRQMAAARGWTGPQWAALNALIMRESGWNNLAQNPTSSAYGIFQFLDSTWGSVGARKTPNVGAQISAGLKYIQTRYGSPAGAWAHEQKFGWYGTGGLVRRPSIIGAGERGPERVLSAEQTRSFEHLVRILDSRPQLVSAAAPDIDYARLGRETAAAMVRALATAGVAVQLDGRTVGEVLGRRSALLQRGG